MVRTRGHHSRRPSTALIVTITALFVLLLGGSGFIAYLLTSDNKVAATSEQTPVMEPTTAPVSELPSDIPSTNPAPTPSGIDPTDLSSTPPNPAPSIDSKICTRKNPPKFTAVLLEDPVNVAEGAKFEIAPCLKKGESIWIFNFDTEKSVYVLDWHTSKSGVQPYTDKVTGDDVVNFILANASCASWIDGQDRNADFGDRVVLNDNLIQHPGCKLHSYKSITVATTQN